MEINLEWEDFKTPNVEIITGFESKFPELKTAKLDKIKKRVDIYEGGNELKQIELLFDAKIDSAYIYELKNQLDISCFYLKHLWYYQSLNPRRFNGSEQTAASIYYQTYYEAFYNKLSSSFDYFLQLINVYYELGLNPNEVTKFEIKKRICELYEDLALSTAFYNLGRNRNFQKISFIRNSFIHRNSVFTEDFKLVGDKHFDKFQYINKTKEAVNHYIKHIIFINTEALPLLYKFKDFKKIK